MLAEKKGRQFLELRPHKGNFTVLYCTVESLVRSDMLPHHNKVKLLFKYIQKRVG